MALYYDKPRRCLTDDAHAMLLTELERLVIEQLARDTDIIPSDAICMAVWGNHGPDAQNGLSAVLSQLRAKCARVGLDEPASRIGKSGLVRSNVTARTFTPERCPHCGQPMRDERPAPVYVRRPTRRGVR